MASVVRTLSAGAGAHGVALTPDCSRLYVTNAYADTLSVFDLTDFRLLKEIPVEDFPEYIAVGPEGQWVLTTNLGGPGSVTLIDWATLAPIRTFRLGTDPHGWALSPDGSRLAIAQLGSSQVYLLDTQTLEAVATYETGTISEWAAFRSPQELWVTNIGADYVSIIDLEAGEVVARVTTGLSPHGIAFTRDGRWAFVSNMKEGTVVKIDTLARRVVGRFSVGGELHNLVVLD
ncbi:MAG: YncE family protein [Anaerolineae bacterium]